jgi:hypothetical protein
MIETTHMALDEFAATYNLDVFTASYIEAMLFTEGVDYNLGSVGYDDISDELVKRSIRECAEFQRRAGDLISDRNCVGAAFPAIKYAGHSFWFTRNGHGCGFWDGDWEESAGKALTALSKQFGEMEVYLGDDGKVYC